MYKFLILAGVALTLVACGGEKTEGPVAPSEGQAPAENVAKQTVEKSEPKKQATKVNIDKSAFDILGIRLGDDITQAENILSNHTPSMKMRRDNIDISNVNGSAIYGLKFDVSLYAESNPQYDAMGKPIHGKEVISISLSTIPNGGKITGMSRTVPFHEPIVRSELVSSLIEKYGKPLYQDDNWLSWSTNMDGAVIDNPKLLQPCTPKRWGYVAFRRDFVSNAMKHCGFVFTIRLQTWQNPDLITTMHLTLYDMPTIMEFNEKTVAYSKVEAEKLRQQELDSAKGRSAPKL